MKRQMKKAVSMALALVVMITMMPSQPMNAAEDMLIVDDQDIAAVSEEDNSVLGEADIEENATDVFLPEIEIIEDGSLLSGKKEETTVEEEASATDYETEMNSEIDAEKKTERETDIVSETEIEKDCIIAVEEVCEIEGYAAASVGKELNYEGFSYILLDDGTAEITGYTGEQSGDLIIPDMINGVSVSRIGDNAFGGMSGFNGKLVLPEGLLHIGNGAFSYCSGFTGNLKLPKTLISIGDSAFEGCNGFTGSLELPEGITNIGTAVFSYCDGFTGNLKLPEGIISIGNGAFWGCSRFTGELNLPQGITSIGDGAFFACCGFTGKLNLPGGITSIGAAAFSFCDGFTGILELPEGLISIGNEAFNNCSGFTGNLEFPKGIISIGTCAFSDCRGISGDIILPQSIETIGDLAFHFSHVEDVIGNFILPCMPTNMGDHVLGGDEYTSQNIRIDIETELKIGQTRQGEVILGGMRLSAPIVKKWSSSSEEIAKISEEGLITAVSVGEVTIHVELYNGIACEVLLNVVNEEDAENNILYTSPEIEKFQDLWVGDQVSIGVRYYFGANRNLSSMEIASGEQYISVVEGGEEGNKSWMITCKEKGEVNLIVNFNSEAIDPVKLKLNIREKPETGIKFEQQTIKLGGRIATLFENVSYGSYPDVYVNADDAEKFEIHGKSGSIAFDDFFCEERHKERRIILYQASLDDGTKFITSVSGAVCPGTINLLFYPYWGEFEAGKEPEKVFSMVIEEPVINQNVKETYEIGEEQEFSVSLDNTDYKDEPLSYIKDGVLTTSEGYVNRIYYIPKLEVLSGQDCVEFVGETEKTTLTLKQRVHFKKAGTVQLKVTFEPSGINASVNNVYRPEKTITIQVRPEDVTAVFDSAGGSHVASQTVASGNCINKPEEPMRSGYKFTGWYQGNTVFDFSKPITGNITLTAKWEKLNVKIESVKANKTSLKLKPGRTYQLTTIVKPMDATNKTLAWSTSNKKVATVSGGKVTAKGLGTATITAKAVDGSGILASCKVTVGYGIKYQLKGGTNNSKNPSIYYKENISLKHPTRKGYLFKGWYTDKNYKKKITKITTKYKKNLTLYAKWEKVSVGKTAIYTLKNVNGRKISLKYKAVNKASGYEILYSTDPKFKKNCIAVLTKNKMLTMKGLTKKKAYYVKVRAYKVDSTGAKVYGKYSAVKKIKITK